MALSSLTTAAPGGKVYLIGAGPGDPSLITLRGKHLLEQAEVVVYDYLANPRLLRHAPPEALLIYAGKKGGGFHAFTQQEINRLLVEHALQGKKVVRLKGGDPFIFGRGGEEIEELAAEGIDFEVVPGVTSASAAATYAGIPITHRDYTASLAFVTGHEDPHKERSSIHWPQLAQAAGTLVIYMGIKNLPEISEKLTAAGRSPETPVAVVRWASTPRQQTIIGTLANICTLVQDAGIKPPALIIVGEVVKLRQAINWFEKRPLFGRRIVVTRSREQASELVSLLAEHGAECLECATIEIKALEQPTVLVAALQEIQQYQWLLFTSPNSVKYFFPVLEQLGWDSRRLAGLKIAAVGPSTAAALRPHGLQADLIPQSFTGEGLAQALIQQGVGGQAILLPQAVKAGDILPQMLRAAKAEVTQAALYENLPAQANAEELRRELASGSLDLLTFTSSSTVQNCMALLGGHSAAALRSILGATRLAAIGPVTAATLREYGLEADIQPQQHTIAALANAIVDYYQQQPPALPRA